MGLTAVPLRIGPHGGILMERGVPATSQPTAGHGRLDGMTNHATAGGRRPIRLGALAPLSRPGFCEAGRHLRAGVELAVELPRLGRAPSRRCCRSARPLLVIRSTTAPDIALRARSERHGDRLGRRGRSLPAIPARPARIPGRASRRAADPNRRAAGADRGPPRPATAAGDQRPAPAVDLTTGHGGVVQVVRLSCVHRTPALRGLSRCWQIGGPEWSSLRI